MTCYYDEYEMYRAVFDPSVEGGMGLQRFCRSKKDVVSGHRRRLEAQAKQPYYLWIYDETASYEPIQAITSLDEKYVSGLDVISSVKPRAKWPSWF